MFDITEEDIAALEVALSDTSSNTLAYARAFLATVRLREHLEISSGVDPIEAKDRKIARLEKEILEAWT
jgi:hypothetical protein